MARGTETVTVPQPAISAMPGSSSLVENFIGDPRSFISAQSQAAISKWQSSPVLNLTAGLVTAISSEMWPGNARLRSRSLSGRACGWGNCTW